jgi:hypothetical protein
MITEACAILQSIVIRRVATLVVKSLYLNVSCLIRMFLLRLNGQDFLAHRGTVR